MNKAKRFFSFCLGLLRNNNFLKILSVFLAIFAWIYILYIVDPVNEKVFDKVEVNMNFEGSVPELNGYMYLMTDTNLTVSITVSGSRTDLLNISKSDIKASLNMDTVVSGGTYNIDVSVNTGNKNIIVTDVYPKNFTIEFAEKAVREIPVELQAAGSLPEGYYIADQKISPETITVTGPANVVNSIASAYINVSLTNIKQNFAGIFPIQLVTESGDSVSRKYLTISDESAEATFTVKYAKDLELGVLQKNSSGGDESSYISVTLNDSNVKVHGSETVLSGYNKYNVGTVDTALILEDGTTVLQIPPIENTVFDKTEVTATVRFTKPTATQTLEVDCMNTVFVNLGSAKTASVREGFITITVRTLEKDFAHVMPEDFICRVDLSKKNPDGTYPIQFINTSGIPYGIVGTYSVNVDIR